MEVLKRLQKLPSKAPPHYLYMVGEPWRDSEGKLESTLRPLVEAGFVPCINAETTTEDEFERVAKVAERIGIRWAPFKYPKDRSTYDTPTKWDEMFDRLQHWFKSAERSCPLIHIDQEVWKHEDYDEPSRTWLAHTYAAMMDACLGSFPMAEVVAFTMGYGPIYPEEVVERADYDNITWQRINRDPMIDAKRSLRFFMEADKKTSVHVSLANGYVEENGKERKVFNSKLEYDPEHNRTAARMVRMFSPDIVIMYPSVPTPQWCEDVVEYTEGWQ